MLLREILYGYYGSICLYVVAKLKVADYLQEKPKTIAEISDHLAVNQEKLYRIMRYLSAVHFFEALPNHTFSLTSESEYLLSSNPCNLSELVICHGELFYPSAMMMFDGIKTNRIPFEVQFKQPFWSYLSEHSVANQLFHQGMKSLSRMHGDTIAKVYDFSPYKTIVDLGGGIGGLLGSILLEYPHLHAINLDLPALKQDADSYFTSIGVSNRCQFMTGDFYHSVPKGGDVYIMKAILHGKSDDKALPILHLIHEVLPPNGRLLIIDRVISRSKNYVDGCVNDIHMLNVSSGKDRSFSEFDRLLKQSGFDISELYVIESSLMLIEAKIKNSTA